MLKIRMQRTGRINMPTYRIVVTEHTRSPKAGNFLEKLGSYNPKTKERILNTERIKYWLSVGAKASGTMHNMLVSASIVQGKKVNVLPRKSPPKAEAAPESSAPAAVPAEAPAEVPAETPASPEVAEAKQE
ncbi:30S ribosomal protein S16 [Candidatus Parcubacteria bacterium]|nr:MAG: 30S ribosomal protein S16 [Candidatus Parcubacteria bacterium]